MAGRFEGKVAFITGAARGQGRAEAIRLAEEGADILAVDLCEAVSTVTYDGATRADLEATEQAVVALGRRIVTRVVDVRDMEALQAAVDEGVAELGRLDVVVANAGICSYGLLWELTEEQFRTMMDVNVVGTWHTLKAAVPTLIAQGTGGAVVVTSSVAGKKGAPWLSHYVASKFAITGMAKTLANEVGQYGIRVVSVHPFGVDTPMGRDETLPALLADAPEQASIFGAILPPALIEPENVAAAVAYIASDDGRHLTGCEFVIDLGHLSH